MNNTNNKNKMEKLINKGAFKLTYALSLVTFLVTGMVTLFTFNGEYTILTYAFLASAIIFVTTRRIVVVYMTDDEERYVPLF